jgi:hypothetical protein
MAGADPAIHVFLAIGTKDVDARHEAGHDDGGRQVHFPVYLRIYSPWFLCVM